MDDFLEGIDLSKLEGAPKQIAEMFRSGAKVTLANISAQSATVAKSASRTVEIGNNALKQVLAGNLDSVGAMQILRRSAEQTEDLARAEGNLLLSNSVSFLKKIGETVMSAVPGFFGK